MHFEFLGTPYHHNYPHHAANKIENQVEDRPLFSYVILEKNTKCRAFKGSTISITWSVKQTCFLVGIDLGSVLI